MFQPLFFCFVPVGSDYIRKVLDNLNLKRVVGCDKISQRVLRLSSPVLADPLMKLINHFIKTSSCSTVWISSVIMPVFKKDNDTDKICYQPVSILTALSKVYERFIRSDV